MRPDCRPTVTLDPQPGAGGKGANEFEATLQGRIPRQHNRGRTRQRPAIEGSRERWDSM